MVQAGRRRWADLTPLIVFFGLMLGAAAGGAAELKPPMIAVVDVQYILQNATATRSIQEAIESQREVYGREITAQEQSLRAAEQDLSQQSRQLSADEFAARRRDFEERLAAVQRTVQERKRQLDRVFNESMGKVREQLLQTVADVARETGATVVLSKQMVVIMERSLDLTETVLQRLNQRLPLVAVDMGQEAPP